jgi:hypothetical protein
MKLPSPAAYARTHIWLACECGVSMEAFGLDNAV